MIKALKYKLYSLLNSRTLRFWMLLAMPLFLSGCENDDDTSLGQEGNYEGQSSCWQTKITNAVIALVNQLYNDSAIEVERGGSNIILVAFAVWMAFRLLRVLGSFKEESLGEVWTEILQKLFLCSVCAYFASRVDLINEAIQLFVVPIYVTILELATSMLENRTAGSVSLGAFGQINFDFDVPACPTNGVAIEAGRFDGIFEISNCVVCLISSRLNSGIRIAVTLISSLKIGAILVGIIMAALFTAAKFFFVLYLVDSLFRLNFAAFLLPVLIIGVPFKYTRKWSKHGFLMFLNSSGIMLFMALLVSLIVKTLEYLVAQYQDDFTPEGIEGFGTGLLAMILISFLLINIPGFAVALTDKFVGGGGGLEFQKKVSEFIVNSLKKLGASALSGITSGATNVITETMEKYEQTRKVLDNVKQVRNATNSMVNKMHSLAGHNDDD